MDLTLTAILLGIVEGLTEFVPVSSTGHLILASELFGYSSAQWAMFNIVIQLGAILAVVVLYWKTFWDAGIGVLKLQPAALRFARNLAVGLLPSVVLGLLLKDYIDILLASPAVVAWALVIGGIAILVIEKLVTPGPDEPVSEMPLKTAIGVGFAQCLAMVPGVSRSGATIMGALGMGVGRKTAAEFSFFLAVPTMLGASILEVSEKSEGMGAVGPVGWWEIGVGFVVSFLVALAVIRAFVAYVSRHGFAPFAWYRIVIGLFAIALFSF
ncbi:undecaprenyl-diphosphate phosphatase [Altericroceibacterium xinjiangense]|uniref:undecaprenyl-diphosphate phosphatase n=1 Tax=Altericroceibacterium xinjiangense TaxID=762261 RepID=UPI000F7D9BA5|nr:undecaprenyl-diphosphate phosphatase [Altericroceibacterium xinjiangense]